MATTTTKATRQPKAKTAYELLEQVCKAITEEPRRYNQALWCVFGKAKIRGFVRSPPPCGTMACRAGWIVALHDGRSGLQRRSAESFGVRNRAEAILDLPEGTTFDLFKASATRGRAGSMAYAKRGVRGLRAFMKQHKAHLQNRKLRGV